MRGSLAGSPGICAAPERVNMRWADSQYALGGHLCAEQEPLFVFRTHAAAVKAWQR